MTLTQEQKQSVEIYKKHGFDFEIDEDVVKIFQRKPINGYILTQKELHDRAREIFPNAKIQPHVFSIDVSEISTNYILEKMKKFGIKNNDLVKQCALKKETVMNIVNHQHHLSYTEKAMFYYYFLQFEINRNIREIL